MKNNIRFISALLAFMVAFSSCESWLDVEPKSQIKDKELFSSEAGFKEALAGVYSTLVDEKLYTREMRFGMIGVLAHEWTNFSGLTYPEATDYAYTATNTEKRISDIWERMYFAIANANSILEVIDDKQTLFTGDNYRIIKGEALALRAFCHFDLLRCFGVSYAVDGNKPCIPYVDVYTSQQGAQLTVDQVAKRVIADLRDALGCLEVDPIRTGEVITELDDNGYLMNRQLHLNYYAVKGLMARVYLYMGEYSLAAGMAEDVIGSGVFEWVSQTDIMGSVDPSAASEQLWGIDVNNLSDINDKYFKPTTGSDGFSLDPTDLTLYYEDPTDYRYLYLFRQSENSASVYYSKKFDGSSATGTSNTYYNNKMSMIRLPEMYFILAECYYNTSGDWLAMFNEVTKARGGVEVQNVSAFETKLTSEYRKELLGEGQMFFLYKRLNLPNIYKVSSDVNLVDVKAYTFPLPESELRASDRQDNR